MKFPDANHETGVVQDLEENLVLAHLLDETADLLESQGADSFRVKAYRNAAEEIRKLETAVRTTWKEHGRGGLDGIPRIGVSLAKAIETWLQTGTLGILFRLRGEEAAEQLLMSVAGVGRQLAHRIHHDLHLSTLEELERAAHNGSLEKLPGIGKRRLQAIRDQLDSRLRLRRSTGTTPLDPKRFEERPSVRELLDVDREYRNLAASGRLPKIAPRRFNRTGQAWLPVLHTHHGQRYYTALFSNTALAHELGRTSDWVVIYLDDGINERQWTVVTERHGPLAGWRVVRGREAECAESYPDQRR